MLGLRVVLFVAFSLLREAYFLMEDVREFMRLSDYFLPVSKENPKEAEIVSHRYMLRSGMIYQQNSGIYSWLPLGKRVLNKICRIIQEEQEKAGALEILMPTIQSVSLWKESGRYEDYGKEMLRIKDRQNREILYGPTNEEMVTDIFRQYVHSYRNLPLNLYHIQWKFRDEIRPRFGVMRSREFLMKDAYSFDLDYASSCVSYHRMFISYLRIFERIGLKAIPMKASSGPIGGDLSHEFIVLADTGESCVYYDRSFLNLKIPEGSIDFKNPELLASIVDEWTQFYAATDEILNVKIWDCVPKDRQKVSRGIEVGHIFNFGTKYSNVMKALVEGPDHQQQPVYMGSYGIGPTRVVAAIIEASHDDRGIIWPKSVAPFEIGIINMKPGNSKCDQTSQELYHTCLDLGIDVLLDDKEESAGSKFATMDLIGLPKQIIVGPRGLENDLVEIKNRATGVKENIPIYSVISYLKKE